MRIEHGLRGDPPLMPPGMIPFREAIERAKGSKRPSSRAFSHFDYELRRDGEVIWEARGVPNLSTTAASGYTNIRDWMAKGMGGGVAAASDWNGAASASSSTSLTNSGAAWTTTGQGLKGMIVACGPNASGTGATVFGVIMSNTSTVLTVDRWYDAGNPGGAAGTTPNATAKYQILPGQMPAMFMAVTSDATTPTTSDTSLATEATTNGFARALATWAHTAGATTYTLTWVITASGSLTPAVVGVFASAVANSGAMPFKTAISSPPAMISGDQLTITETVTNS